MQNGIKSIICSFTEQEFGEYMKNYDKNLNVKKLKDKVMEIINNKGSGVV